MVQEYVLVAHLLHLSAGNEAIAGFGIEALDVTFHLTQNFLYIWAFHSLSCPTTRRLLNFIFVEVAQVFSMRLSLAGQETHEDYLITDLKMTHFILMYEHILMAQFLNLGTIDEAPM